MRDARITTTITVPRSTWEALRRLAELRAQLVGGRPALGAAIEELVRESEKARTPRADA